MKTKSQEFSEIVFNQIQVYLSNSTEDIDIHKKYKSLCKRSGGVMRTVGLIQYLTFLRAKAAKEPQHGLLLKHLSQELAALKVVNTNDVETFVQSVRNQSLPNYMRTTTEVLRLLQWHKRIADILIDSSTDSSEVER